MTERAVTFLFRWINRLAAAAAVAFGLYCLWALLYYGADSRSFTWSYTRTTAGSFEVSSVDPGGPANGLLKPGDRLLSINGSEFLLSLAPALGARAIGADG